MRLLPSYKKDRVGEGEKNNWEEEREEEREVKEEKEKEIDGKESGGRDQ